MIKHNWKSNVHFSKECAGFQKQILDIITKLHSMCDGQLIHVSVAKHSIEKSPKTLNRFTLHPTGRGQKPKRLKKQGLTKCRRKESLNLPRQNGSNWYYLFLKRIAHNVFVFIKEDLTWKISNALDGQVYQLCWGFGSVFHIRCRQWQLASWTRSAQFYKNQYSGPTKDCIQMFNWLVVQWILWKYFIFTYKWCHPVISKIAIRSDTSWQHHRFFALPTRPC